MAACGPRVQVKSRARPSTSASSVQWTALMMGMPLTPPPPLRVPRRLSWQSGTAKMLDPEIAPGPYMVGYCQAFAFRLSDVRCSGSLPFYVGECRASNLAIDSGGSCRKGRQSSCFPAMFSTLRMCKETVQSNKCKFAANWRGTWKM